MEKGITYNYDPSTKTLKKSSGKSTKGLTPRQQKTTKQNYNKDKTGSDPFWPKNT